MGWILFDPKIRKTDETSILSIIKQTEDTTPMDFKEFWRLKHMGITTQELNDPGFLINYQNTIIKDSDGRYEVLFPFKDNRKTMEKNKNIATVRLL
jgi:transposase